MQRRRAARARRRAAPSPPRGRTAARSSPRRPSSRRPGAARRRGPRSGSRRRGSRGGPASHRIRWQKGGRGWTPPAVLLQLGDSRSTDPRGPRVTPAEPGLGSRTADPRGHSPSRARPPHPAIPPSRIGRSHVSGRQGRACHPIPSDDAIERAAAFTREPFVLEGEDAAAALAPGSPRRRALDAALAELEAGAKVPSVAWRQRWSLLLGLDRLLSQDEPKLVDGTVLSAHQVDALSGTLTALLAESGNGSSNGAGPESEPAAPLASAAIPGEEELDDEDEPEEPQDWDDEAASSADDEVQLPEAPEDPNAGEALLVRARDRRRQDRRGARLRRGLAHRRHADPHPPPQPRRPVPRRAARPRLRQADRPAARARPGPRRRPGDGRDLPVVRPQRGQRLRRLHDRHLRRGAHRAGREDVGVDPQLARAGVRRHDGDGRADRPPRHRPLPDADVALRPRAGRPPRRHLPAALRADPARPRRAHDRQGAAAPRRGRHRVRPGDAGRAARPAAVQPRGRRPLQDALQRRAGRRLRGRRAPRLQRRPGVPRRRHEGAGRVGRDAEARAGRDPRPLRARRDRRARQRPAARRGLELAPRDRLHAPRADGVEAHLPAARRPRHAPAPRQGGRHRRRLRPSRDEARRPGRHAPLAARPRGLPRRGDRRRPGAPRARAAAARRAPRAAGHGGREPAHRGLRARAVADRRRAPRLRRAGPVGRAGGRARRAGRLAPRAGDAPLRPGRRAQAHVPDHRRRPQQERGSCGCARCRRSPRRATPRRSTARWTSSSPGRARTSARASRSSSRRSPRRRSAGATRPTTGSGAART